MTAIEGTLPDALESIGEDSLDVVLSISVLEHLWDPAALLRELRRVAAPGGVCLVNVPSWRGKRYLELSARLGLSPAEEIRRPQDLLRPGRPLAVAGRGRLSARGHRVLPAQVRPQHLRRLQGPEMSFSERYLDETGRIVGELDRRRGRARRDRSRRGPRRRRTSLRARRRRIGRACGPRGQRLPQAVRLRDLRADRQRLGADRARERRRLGDRVCRVAQRLAARQRRRACWCSRSAAAASRRRSPAISLRPSTTPAEPARAIFGDRRT